MSVVGYVLVDGRAFFDRSIVLFVMFVGTYYVYWQSTFYYNAATSVCSCLTVLTIFVVFVVYGDSSSCSTHLNLLRRFSILYAYFYTIASVSCVLYCALSGAIVFYFVCLFSLSCYICNCYYMNISRFCCMASSYSLYLRSHRSSIASMVSALTITYLFFILVRVSIVLFDSSHC